MRLLIPKGSVKSAQDVIELIQVYYKVKETNTYWAEHVADTNLQYDIAIIGEVGRLGFCYDYGDYMYQYDIRHSPDSIILGEIEW